MFNPFTWISGVISKFQSTIGAFLKTVFNSEMTLVIAKLKDPAIAIVQNLMSSDLSSAEKRNQALASLAAEAKALGLDVGKSALNLLLELAVQYVKTLK